MDERPWMNRAAAWELTALSLRYPTTELARAIASGEWADAAEEIVAATGACLLEGFAADARGCMGEDAEALETFLHSLRAEATRLFVGAPDPVVSPFEGIWRAADDGVRALLFVNPHSMDVERFCRACGLGRPEGTNEPLDHAATECELLQWLAMRAAGAVAEGSCKVADADLPGCSPAAAHDAFLRDHALAWLPRFARAVAAEARLPFYRAAAALLAALVEVERVRLG